MGLDIGTTLIKVVEIARARGAAELLRAGVHPTPEGGVADGSVLDPQRVAAAVKEAMRDAGIRSSEVYAAVAGEDVVVRHAVFPRMTPEELGQAVKWDAGAYIPYPTKDANIDYEVIGSPADSPDKVEVMIVAAPKKLVQSHVETMQLAGVYPIALDIQPITLDRIFRSAGKDTAGFYADIGGGTTDLAYSEGGVLRFTRIVPIGGNDFTSAVAAAAGRSMEWAEAAKRRSRVPAAVGVRAAAGEESSGEPPSDDPSSRPSPEGESSQDDLVGSALAGVAGKLALELRRSLDYCGAQSRTRLGDGASVSRLILTGGGSRLAGLAEFLEAVVGVRMVPGDPLRNVSLGRNPRLSQVLASHGPSLSVAIGLALRGVGER